MRVESCFLGGQTGQTGQTGSHSSPDGGVFLATPTAWQRMATYDPSGVAWDCGPVRVENCSYAVTTLIPRPLAPASGRRGGALGGRSDKSDKSDKSVVQNLSSLRTAYFPSQCSSRVRRYQRKSGHLFEAAACVHQVITGANYFLRRRASATAAPISAGEGATTIPAASSAATFSAAVPLPPVMIAPA